MSYEYLFPLAFIALAIFSACRRKKLGELWIVHSNCFLVCANVWIAALFIVGRLS